MMSLPLFPLHTVLFPGGLLPLRVFEQRYMDMVAHCLRNNRGFGVSLISAGREVGKAADCCPVGTLAIIADWGSTEEGLLSITALGEQRFRILQTAVQPDQLTMAQVEPLTESAAQHLPVQYAPLSRLLERLLDDLGPPFDSMPRALDDAHWVSGRLTEFLPLDVQEKQSLLELDDPLTRLAILAARLGR